MISVWTKHVIAHLVSSLSIQSRSTRHMGPDMYITFTFI